MNESLIIFGGFYNILLIIFHVMFWRIFDWDEDLKSLTFLNRSTIQVLNISITNVNFAANITYGNIRYQK